MEKSPMVVVGFDCAADSHVGVVLDETGRFDWTFEVRNRRRAIQDALAKLLLKIPSEMRLAVALEAKRSYGRLVTDVAKELGCEVWQVNPKALNHYRDVEGQPRKDDERDAYLAARMVFFGLHGCHLVLDVSEEERTISRLVRTHSQATKARSQAISRLYAILLELAPAVVSSSWQGPKLGSKAMLYILDRWHGFEGMENAQLRSIENILYKCRYGERRKTMAKALRQVAREISMAPSERTAVTLEMNLLIGQIKALDTSLKQLTEEIKQRVSTHPVGDKLMKMVAIGPIVAGVLASQLLPLARHASEPECATYSGVTPLSRRSGKSLDTARLGRGSNKWILDALYTSAVAAVSHSAIDRAYFQKKLADYAGHPKPHVAAYLALARQRHKLIYKLMTTDAHYDKEILVAQHLERVKQQHVATQTPQHAHKPVENPPSPPDPLTRQAVPCRPVESWSSGKPSFTFPHALENAFGVSHSGPPTTTMNYVQDDDLTSP